MKDDIRKCTDRNTIVALQPGVNQVSLFIFYHREGVAMGVMISHFAVW